MKALKIILIAMMAVLSLSSCTKEILTMMEWEFYDYDTEAISVESTNSSYLHVEIVADSNYSGAITVKCTNYPRLSIMSNEKDGTYRSDAAGFTAKKIDDNTVRITFEPIERTEEDDVYDILAVDGKNGKQSCLTNMSISRVFRSAARNSK